MTHDDNSSKNTKDGDQEQPVKSHPQDLLDALDKVIFCPEYVPDYPALRAAYRKFVADCVEFVRHRLPEEANQWIGLVDAFEQGNATSEQMSEAFEAAWKLNRDRREVSSCAMEILIELLRKCAFDHRPYPGDERDSLLLSLDCLFKDAPREGASKEQTREAFLNAFQQFLV